MPDSLPPSQVQVLTDAPSLPFAERWFELATAEHFWFEWRLHATLGLLQGAGIPLDADWRALEVGCGTAVLRGQLEAATAWRIDGADLDRDGLARAEPGRGALYVYDVHDRRPELREAYDAIVLFDVLEHIEARPAFLDAVLDHLRPGGLLLVNVPALQALYSRYDEAAGHHLRYDHRSLAAELGAHRLEVLATRYWGLSMIPLLALRKLLVARMDPERVIEVGFQPPGRLADRVLRGVMHAESALLRSPPRGSSLLLVARKGS